jgi:hypothetical protein
MFVSEQDRRSRSQVLSSRNKKARVPITLVLRSNNIGNNGAWFLAEAIKVARVPITLDLSDNIIGNAGVKLLAQSLKEARIPCALDLNLDFNFLIEVDGQMSLEDALTNNFIIDAKSNPSKFLSRIEFSLCMRMMERALGFPSVLVNLVHDYIGEADLALIYATAIRAIEDASRENKYDSINYKLLAAAYLLTIGWTTQSLVEASAPAMLSLTQALVEAPAPALLGVPQALVEASATSPLFIPQDLVSVSAYVSLDVSGHLLNSLALKFNQFMMYQSIQYINAALHKTSLASKALDLGVDSGRLLFDPSLNNAKKVALDSAHLYGMMQGINGLTTVVSGAEAAYKAYQGEYQEAFNIITVSGVATALPYVAYTGRVEVKLLCLLGITGYTAYHSVTNALSFAQELYSAQTTDLDSESIKIPASSGEAIATREYLSQQTSEPLDSAMLGIANTNCQTEFIEQP